MAYRSRILSKSEAQERIEIECYLWHSTAGAILISLKESDESERKWIPRAMLEKDERDEQEKRGRMILIHPQIWYAVQEGLT